MADYGTTAESSTAGPSTRSSSPPPNKASSQSIRSQRSARSSESTPLLARRDSEDQEPSSPLSSATSSLLRSINGSTASKQSSRRWPSFIALLLLCTFTITIMLLGFFVPEVMEEYAMQAKDFELTSISLPEFTAGGAKARIQGVFRLDAGKVHKKYVRDIGIIGTWVAGAVESKESTVEVSLPEYGGIILGTAVVPPIVVNLRNGRRTEVDFLADLTPGDVGGIRKVADDWVSGRLGQLRVLGEANVQLKSGIFSLGSQAISQSLVFAGDEIPKMPAFNITKLNFHEAELPNGKGMAADVSIWVKNDYPISVSVPPLGFGILVDNCSPDQPHIMVADSLTNALSIHPKSDVNLNVTGNIRRFPHKLVSECPGSGKSPLDSFIKSYIHGDDSTIYVQGSDSPSVDTPKWLSELMSSITVPVPFRGHTFDKLIRNFSLTDVHFGLPDPWAAPGSPESDPMISANIKALINLPQEMNFPVDVDRVRAKANVFYKGDKLGRLDLHKWQAANSTRVPAHGSDSPALLVESHITDAPLIITNDDVFSDIVQKLLFGGKPVMLSLKAEVDVEMETTLGTLTVRDIPAEGDVPVKPIMTGDGGLTGFSPKIGNLTILESSPDGLTIQALVNFTNPTSYSATVPYADIKLLTNGTMLGHITARNLTIVSGNNTNLLLQAEWEPFIAGGAQGKSIGRELLSQYISGYNTTISLRTHKGTLPSQPALGKALSGFTITIPTPRMHSPKPPADGDGPENPPEEDAGKPHFIQEATMHLFSSTANFVLLSPLSKTTLYITKINATAFYKQDDVGKIEYELPFAVPPGASTTPRLPVDWSLGSVGYEALRKAIGGELKLSARAEVGIRIGRYDVGVWFRGGGIGAKVRL
ncbi:hypothetical protein EG327_002813 [Venturia inaequalis]|uniref:Pre-rRNA processing protein n=1 Tax=Venturia inaequalis TaxID=5025 RepID=A0A8H3Z8E6_VENIN|nr:hypothetical protein EG327_002813 [Venturia inaequalis]